MKDPFGCIASMVMDPELWGIMGYTMMHKETPIPADSYAFPMFHKCL